MKTERAILQLARRNLDVKQIATKLNIHPQSVIKTGRSIGVYFTPLEREWAARQRTKMIHGHSGKRKLERDS